MAVAVNSHERSYSPTVGEKPMTLGYPILGALPHFRRDPLAFVVKVSRDFGGVVEFRLGWQRAYLVTHPDYIKHILQDNWINYPKSKYTQMLRAVIGRAMLLAHGDEWQAQRQIAAPAFQGARLRTMVRHMSHATETMLARWRERKNRDEPVDVAREMMRLTLDVLLRSMFSVRLQDEYRGLYGALSDLLRDAERRFWSYVHFPDWMPIPANRKRAAALEVLDDFVARLIANRIGSGRREDDLLQVLIDAYASDGNSSKPSPLLRDEAVQFVIAGHDTTANAITWTLYLLAMHPEVDRRLRDEVEHVLQRRLPTFEDVPKLKYTTMVIQESMRLLPPVWTFSRDARGDDQIGGVHIKKGATIIISPYAVHRRADLWPNPDAFDPERFSPELAGKRDRYAFIPFGGGPRGCFGARFATLEAVVILAMVSQEFRLELVPGQVVEPEPMISLRPRSGLLMSLAGTDRLRIAA